MTLRNRAIFLAALALALSPFALLWGQQEERGVTSPLRVTAGDCQTCHPAHYQEWEQSYHSQSMSAMQAAFKKYITTEEQAKGRPLNRNELMGCLGCHAPAMRFASDNELARLVQLVKSDQREAIGGLSVDCLACHALFGSGRPESKPPEEMANQVYYATIRNPERTAHGAQYAQQMETSEFCRGCHTYVTPAEMKLDADWDIVCSLTYDSWATGPHGLAASGADRKECQSCHMEKKDGQAAEVPGLRLATRTVSSHLFPSWRDASVLQRAAELQLDAKPGTRSNTAELTVTIDNKAGHRIPDT